MREQGLLDASCHPELLLDTLAHQAQLVVGIPALYYLAFRREAEDSRARDFISLPVGAMPWNSPWWVPRIVPRDATLSPSAICSSMMMRKSGKAERNSPTKRFTSSGPRSSTDPSGWWETYRSKISSTTSRLFWFQASSR